MWVNLCCGIVLKDDSLVVLRMEYDLQGPVVPLRPGPRDFHEDQTGFVRFHRHRGEGDLDPAALHGERGEGQDGGEGEEAEDDLEVAVVDEVEGLALPDVGVVHPPDDGLEVDLASVYGIVFDSYEIWSEGQKNGIMTCFGRSDENSSLSLFLPPSSARPYLALIRLFASEFSILINAAEYSLAALYPSIHGYGNNQLPFQCGYFQRRFDMCAYEYVHI